MSYNDRPNEEPSLNFDLYAKELGKIAVKATTGNEGAFTVGIFGSWGSGKTTLMRCIERKFKNFLTEFKSEEFEFYLHNFDATKFRTIWFNPWKYDDTHGIRNALIQTILREMAENSQKAIVKEKCNKLATRYNTSECILHIGGHLVGAALQSQMWGVNPLEIIKGIGKLSGGTKENREQNDLAKELELDTDPYLFINSFEVQFREVVKEYVGENGRLVIFIDDLDRCLPENALTVLESLKLYLDNANCVFFIGLDKRVIEQAVKQRYQDLNVTGKEYIEKMIQLNFFLPEKNSNQVTKVLQHELNELVACPNYPIDGQMWRMILAATKGNFRKTKQFVIAWALIRNLAVSLKVPDEKIPKLAKILLIQMNFPELYDALPTKDHQLIGHLKEIIDAYSQSTEAAKEALTKYPECKRFFADSHLRSFLKGNAQDGADYADISDPEDLRKVLEILSQTGR